MKPSDYSKFMLKAQIMSRTLETLLRKRKVIIQRSFNFWRFQL